MEKKNTELIVTIVILVIALFATSGFIVYDKVLKDNTTTNEETENDEKNEENETIEEQPNEEITENSYEIFANNMKNAISTKYDENNYNYKSIESECVKDGYNVELKKDNRLYYINSGGTVSMIKQKVIFILTN